MSKTIYDVAIIGGGPTGSTAATLLARMGHSVLLLERESFPREHVGESLIPFTYNILETLGVIPELKKIATRKPGVNFVSSDGRFQSTWCFKRIINQPSYLSFHVLRSEFDNLLLKNSLRAGATVLQETKVKDVDLTATDKKVNVTAEHKGEHLTYRAKFLIDASGQDTFLGKKLGVKRSYDGLDRVAIFNHWTKTAYDNPLKSGMIKIVYLSDNKKGWAWVIPISAEHLSIGVVLNNSYVKQHKALLLLNGINDWQKELYQQEIFSSPALKKLLIDAHTCHRTLMIGDYSYYCELKYGDNFAIVGDAGAFLDPIFSSGIYVGMHSAELVAKAIHAKLRQQDSLTLLDCYDQISGAVGLLEKFIKLFYTPKTLNFSMMGDPQKHLFEQQMKVYTIFHYMLAGDFFYNHGKYSRFLDLMQSDKTLAQFQSLIKSQPNLENDNSCHEAFDRIFGEMEHEIKFDPKIC